MVVDSPRRILFLTAETWPTFRSDVSVLFGKYLPQYGIPSDLVAGRVREASAWGGGEAHLFDAAGGRGTKHLKGLVHATRELLSADPAKYGAIQVRDLTLLAVIALLIARKKGLPFYYWLSYLHSEGQIELAKSPEFTGGLAKRILGYVRGMVGCFLLYRFVLPNSNHVFVQSEKMKSDLTGRGVSPIRMTPVPMGVDLEATEFDGLLPAVDPRLTGRRVLVYLGTLVQPRRVETLFEMIARVKAEIPEAVLLLVGDTQDAEHRAWLKRKASAAGVETDVVWTGWLPTREAWRYVLLAEVGLSPVPRGHLLDVSSPTKVPEYLALGVPVVCNDNPDQQRLIEQSEAGLCVPYTAEDFARAAVTLMRKGPAERSRMIESGKAAVALHRSYRAIAIAIAARYAEIQSGTA